MLGLACHLVHRRFPDPVVLGALLWLHGRGIVHGGCSSGFSEFPGFVSEVVPAWAIGVGDVRGGAPSA